MQFNDLQYGEKFTYEHGEIIHMKLLNRYAAIRENEGFCVQIEGPSAGIVYPIKLNENVIIAK